MPHPLVIQLRFARSELVRCLEGVSDEDARRRIQPMNCISWIIGHLADQENRYWVLNAQGKTLAPELKIWWATGNRPARLLWMPCGPPGRWSPRLPTCTWIP